MKNPWEKEHHPSVNVLAKPCTYVADVAGGEPTTFRKNGVLHAAMAKQQLLDGILGKLKILIEKEFAEKVY